MGPAPAHRAAGPQQCCSTGRCADAFRPVGSACHLLGARLGATTAVLQHIHAFADCHALCMPACAIAHSHAQQAC